MSERRRTILRLVAAGILLLAVSAYRQISIHFWPDDVLRPYIVYAVYMVLLLRWQYSIHTEISQKMMRILITIRNQVSIFYLTIRLIQDAFLYKDIPAMRFTGYFISFIAVLMPLLGFYAALYLGKSEEYRISSKWYLLLIPAALLILMAMTDGVFHLYTYIDPAEPQPNLYFHPYIGVWMTYLWILIFILLQTVILHRRTEIHRSRSFLKKCIPFYEPILLFLFSIPYLLASFLVDIELVEFSAGMIFIDILCWKLYILLGLIPVNTRYEDVFQRSTIAMQILNSEGDLILRSENAADISPEVFRLLKKQTNLQVENQLELHFYEDQENCIVWQNDISQIRQVVRELETTYEAMKEKEDLLSLEIQTRSEEVNVRVRNEIYDYLAQQVSSQLELLTRLLEEDPESLEDWNRICAIGTYIKRFSNLQLIYQESSQIPLEDFRISLKDLIQCMERLGILVSLDFSPTEEVGADLILCTVKGLELILEESQFSLQTIQIRIRSQVEFEITGTAIRIPSRELDQHYRLQSDKTEQGYLLRIISKNGGGRMKTQNVSEMVKRAIDSYPGGICFSTQEGRVILANQKMNALVLELTGHTVLNAESTWKELVNGDREALSQKLNPAWLSQETGVFFRSADESVWRFEYRSLDEDYMQLEAMDVTQLYRLSEDLYEKTEALQEMQERQKALLENIVQVNQTRETLAAKMRIHDEFGRCLLVTNKAISDQHISRDKEMLQESWKDSIRSFMNMTEQLEEEAGTLQTELMQVAEMIGCRIVLHGEWPNHSRKKHLLYAAVREALINAVRHANATELQVKIQEEEGCCHIEISDNGEAQVTEITEGTGLGTLRTHLEQEGASMKILCQGHVVLVIEIPHYTNSKER